MTTGGIYLGGGILPRIISFFKDDYFLKSMKSKDEMSTLNMDIPIHMITNQKAALIGSAVRVHLDSK